ncbi:MAG TPA: viral replication protein [Ruminiclostridium sp.]|nr:viral replication protein [Ruminiclostridium sp.]
MADNEQGRKWLLTINNPLECSLTHDAITEKLLLFSLTYYCMADEIAPTGTYHTHVFFYSASPVRFSTVKRRFPTAHIDKTFGTCQQNRDYVAKSGKWMDTSKAETSVEGSFTEWGDMPAEKAEKAPAMVRLMDNIQEGMTTAQIIEDDPKLAFKVRDIDTLRQTLLSEKYATENRRLEVTYLFGATGAGKTRYIYSQHNPRDICRITTYREGKGVLFDAYHGQDVLVLEEFHSQVPIEEMLNYLDIYPLYLPARYSDKVACYTQVYITGNLPLIEQYKAVQWGHYETWRAFLRRIHRIIEYKPDGSVTETICNERTVLEDGKQQEVQAGTADEAPLPPVAPQMRFYGPFNTEE